MSSSWASSCMFVTITIHPSIAVGNGDGLLVMDGGNDGDVMMGDGYSR